MNAIMDANTGIDIDTALMAFLVARSFRIEKISRFRTWKIRFKNAISQPKNLTNRTDDRISWVKVTRWSVILLIDIRRLRRLLIARARIGIETASSAKPARALYVKLTMSNMSDIKIWIGAVHNMWKKPDAWSTRYVSTD